MKTLLNGGSKTLPNVRTSDHYHSTDSFSIVRCFLFRKYPKNDFKNFYYLIENQTFNGCGFVFQKVRMVKGGGLKIRVILRCIRGPGSSVSMATRYGMDGPGIESRWGEISRTCPDRPWGPPNFLYMGTGSFLG
jgi:hypothetical protein